MIPAGHMRRLPSPAGRAPDLAPAVGGERRQAPANATREAGPAGLRTRSTPRGIRPDEAVRQELAGVSAG